jgi:PKD repeat protein
MNINATSNSNLTCIEVDDSTWATTNWTSIGIQPSFSEDCNNGCFEPPAADFTASSTNIAEGTSITFTDNSTNYPTSRSWQFSGGTPSTSTDQNPIVVYSTAGTFDVALTVTNALGSDTKTKIGYITVTSTTGIEEPSTRPKDLLYITDVLGRTTHPLPNRVLFYIYDDGSVEKKIQFER